MYNIRYNEVELDFDELDKEFGFKKREEKAEPSIYGRAGETPLEELSEAERIRVYAGYTQSISAIVERFDLAIKSVEYEKKVNKNRLKNFRDDIIRSILLVAMVALALYVCYALVRDYGGLGAGLGGFGGTVAAIGGASITTVYKVLIPVIILFMVIIPMTPVVISRIIQYACYNESKAFLRTINKNKMATYINQELYCSKCIIELQKKRQPYVDLLERIRRKEILKESDVAFTYDFSSKDLSVPANPYKFYKLRARDAWAIIRHKDNWAPTSVKESDVSSRERVPWYKIGRRK